MAGGRRLTRQAWIEATLEMAADVGIDAVAVETLATRLQATKGSFYWHFADRADLVRAALDEWRERETSQVIAAMDALPPEQRLARLLEHSVRGPAAMITLGVITATADPVVATTVAEVHNTRIDYLSDLVEDGGVPAARVRVRARIAYAAFLGHLLLLGRRPAVGDEELAIIRSELEGMLRREGGDVGDGAYAGGHAARHAQ